jgi:predicted metal-dependent peptidase
MPKDPEERKVHEAREMQRWLDAMDLIGEIEEFEWWDIYANSLKVMKSRGWCTTAATDGANVYFNPEFSAAMNDKEVNFVAIHEVAHVASKHSFRVPESIILEEDPQIRRRKFRLWNEACDFAIHSWLKPLADGVLSDKLQFPQEGLFDARFDGMGAESIYEIIEAEKKPESPGGFDVHVIVIPKGLADKIKLPKGSKRNKNGSVVVVINEDGEFENLPEEEEEDKSGEGQGDGDGKSDEEGDEDPIPGGLSEEDLEEIANEVSRQLGGGGGEMGGSGQGWGAGNTKRGVARQPTARKETRAWRIPLIHTIISQVKTEYDWNRPNRRYLARSGLVVPGMRGEEMEGVLVFDVSGSISKELYTTFAEEFESLRGQLPAHKLHLLWIDTIIQKQCIIEPGGTVDWELVGGGGTDFRPAFQYVEDNKLKPSFLAYFTDLYGTFPDQEPEYPTLWIVWPSYGKAHYPWGNPIWMDEGEPAHVG